MATPAQPLSMDVEQQQAAGRGAPRLPCRAFAAGFLVGAVLRAGLAKVTPHDGAARLRSPTAEQGAPGGTWEEYVRMRQRREGGVARDLQGSAVGSVRPAGATQAIVIGAGPAGLACALALADVCEKVYLVERYASFEKRGATFGMAKNGQLALGELSPELLEHMREAGVGGGPTGMLMFVWWEMRDALLKFVREKRNIELFCGEKFTHIHDDDHGVKVTFQSGLELAAGFVVGADGVHSQVRSNVLGLAPPIASPDTLFRGNLQVPETASDELKGCLEKGMVPFAVDNGGKVYFILFNFHQGHPGRLAWVLSTSVNIESSEERVTPFDLIDEYVTEERDRKMIEEVLSLSDESHLEPYPKISMVDLSNDTLETYEDGGWGGRGRVTLIGDAAHAMRPTDGFGGSMAMEDAVVLRRILKNSAGERAPIQDLLRRYERERLPRVKKVYNNQCERYDTRMRTGARPGPQSEEFMDWLLAGV